MGGRGSSGGGTGNAESVILKTSPVMRISYKDYKNILRGRGGVDGTYDASTKSIEVNVGRGLHAAMDATPDNYANEMGQPKLKAVLDVYNDFLVDTTPLPKNSPAWARKVEKIVRAAEKLDSRYGINRTSDLSQYWRLKRQGY